MIEDKKKEQWSKIKKETIIENKKGTMIDKMLHRKLNIDDKHWIKNR
jgi:hypothetical protein